MRRIAINAYHCINIDKLVISMGVFDKSIDASVTIFSSSSKLSKEELKNDIKNYYYKYLTTPDEYFPYYFEWKDAAYKRSFLV